mgnify:CR=1 FL=1
MLKRKITIGGKEIVIPSEEITGKEIKKIAGIPDNRQLVAQGKDGSVRVSDSDKVKVSPDMVFDDVPNLKFG